LFIIGIVFLFIAQQILNYGSTLVHVLIMFIDFKVDASASKQSETKKRKKLVETHSNRERQKYFADDDKYDLKTMFQREKLSTAEDQNGMLSRFINQID